MISSALIKGKKLGIDVGETRVGLAISDVDGLIALPLVTLENNKNIYLQISKIVDDNEISTIVIGLPYTLTHKFGKATVMVENFTTELMSFFNNSNSRKLETGINLFFQDERFTTLSSKRLLHNRELQGRKHKKIIDQCAAMVMLQTWLDSHKKSRGF